MRETQQQGVWGWIKGLGWLGAAATSLLGVTCKGSAGSAEQTIARLPAGSVARVGDELVSNELVQQIAQAQHVSLARARELAISDAVWAHDAKQRFPNAYTTLARRSTLAREMLENLAASVSGAAPTATELADLLRERWYDFDRPETVQTAHAVVLVKAHERSASAEQLANALRLALIGTSNPEKFVEIAKKFAAPGFEIRAERLPPVTADGRLYYPDGKPDGAPDSLVVDYARAAHELLPGALSPVTLSEFGYHVILCETRLPPRKVPAEELSELLRPEVLSQRRAAAFKELMARLRGSTPVELSRAVDQLTQLAHAEK